MITIKDIAGMKSNDKPYLIADICKYGYLVKDTKDDTVSLKDLSWVKDNAKDVEGFVGIYEDKPLIYSADEEQIFWGNSFAQIRVNIKIQDDKPGKRYYADSVVRLNEDEISGKITDIDISVKEYSSKLNKGYEVFCTCSFEGYIPHQYSENCLKAQRGSLSLKDDKVMFSFNGKKEFSRYSSGCGYAEYYIIPRSEYKKYVSCNAVIGGIGDDFHLSYLVSEDPEFLFKKKIESLSQTIDINSDTVYETDQDGHYEETIEDCEIYLQRSKKDSEECNISVKYIPKEYKHHRKAIEYESSCSVSRFYNRIDDITSDDTKAYFLNTVQHIIDDARNKGITVLNPTDEWLEEEFEKLREKEHDL